MKCISPKTIYNRYLQQYVTVPCGECAACKILKKNLLCSKVSNECDNYAYNIFFSLTYDNDHIPIVKRNSNIVYLRRRKVLSPRYYDYNEHCYKRDTIEVNKYDYLPVSDFNLDTSLSNITSYGGIDTDNVSNGQYLGVLYKKDIQNYLKKLRYEIKKAGFSESLRYFICGEYGGRYFRPHYHGILHTNNESLANWLLQNIIPLWSFSSLSSYSQKNCSGNDGKPKLISGKGVCSYVSKYVSLFDNVSKTKSCSLFRPFYLCSKRPCYGLSTFDKEVFQNVIQGTDYDIERTVISNRKSITVSVSDTLQGQFYSRFDGIDKYSIDELCHLVIQNDVGESGPIRRFVSKVRNVLKRNSFVNVITYTYVREYLQRVRQFVSRLNFNRIKQSMSCNFDINYLMSKINTFSDIIRHAKRVSSDNMKDLMYNLYDRFFNCNIPLRESLFVALCEFLFYDDKFYGYFRELNRMYIVKYQKSLLPKHFSNLNF